jgi:hypothetical protein
MSSILTERRTDIQNQAVTWSRLTALWAFSESGLGGVLHAFNMPFSGIPLIGISVMILSLIGYFCTPRQILKSLVIVLLIKAIVSPQSPVGAYFAVTFQGILAFLLFSVNKGGNSKLYLLAVLSFIESALQKVIIMTLIFGKSIWKAIDAFGDHVLDQFSFIQDASLSTGLISGYIGLYTVIGFLFGYLCTRLPKKIHSPELQSRLMNLVVVPEENNGKRNKSRVFTVVTIVTIAILIYLIDRFYNLNLEGTNVLLRVSAVLCLWYLFVVPTFQYILQKMVSRKKGSYSEEIKTSLSFFPLFRSMANQVWKISGEKTGLRRISYFFTLFIAGVLLYKD